MPDNHEILYSDLRRVRAAREAAELRIAWARLNAAILEAAKPLSDAVDLLLAAGRR